MSPYFFLPFALPFVRTVALPLAFDFGVEPLELTLPAREVWAVEDLLVPFTALSALFCIAVSSVPLLKINHRDKY